jgi:hypothetical protein
MTGSDVTRHENLTENLTQRGGLGSARVNVHVYVDGFNLYRGGREIAGAQPGWKWLDIRSLASGLAAAEWGNDAVIGRVVYCTAPLKPDPMNPDQVARQQLFIRALRAHGSIDHLEEGRFIEKVKTRPLATRSRKGKPILVTPQPPVFVKDGAAEIRGAWFFVSVADREEKGSDVNVASHLLIDALNGQMEAAIVLSNDSDLALPVREVRRLMPLGIVNPGRGYTAGALTHDPAHSVGGQWERQLTFEDFAAHQMPAEVDGYEKPADW